MGVKIAGIELDRAGYDRERPGRDPRPRPLKPVREVDALLNREEVVSVELVMVDAPLDYRS
jgi:hypothetical protein